ncbi:MAG TPA: HesA/MoeB/ThiF family protein [Phnomibacter sp.]|nr:HesA/MoeB/ThiF family protein [Phnomibacter sp.]
MPTYDRYHRQIILKGFGEAAQQKLLHSKVLVIGAGGLGCPVLQYLAAAGVGHIGIADDDTVSLSNLQRQPLYSMQHIGQLKVEVARQKLLELNPDISIEIFPFRWQPQHCVEYFPAYDLVVDGSDNFATRYMINDACVLLGKPLVFGAVGQFDGQLGLLNALQTDGSFSCNYRDLFAEQPAENAVANCAQAGVLGVLPAVIGSMMATEVIKWITGIGILPMNKVIVYQALSQEIFSISLQKNTTAAALIPASIENFLAMEYAWACEEPGAKFAISIPAFYELLDSMEVAVIDVRNYDETPVIDGFADRRIPLSLLENHLAELDAEALVFVCQTGVRSLAAASLASKMNPGKSVYSLQGGMEAYCAQRNLNHHE